MPQLPRDAAAAIGRGGPATTRLKVRLHEQAGGAGVDALRRQPHREGRALAGPTERGDLPAEQSARSTLIATLRSSSSS